MTVREGSQPIKAYTLQGHPEAYYFLDSLSETEPPGDKSIIKINLRQTDHRNEDR